MKLTITINDEKKEIELKNPRGRDVKKGLKLLISTQKLDDNEKIEKIEEYMDYIDIISAFNTGMTVDELDDLDADEKSKINEFYASKVTSRLDFLKSSLMPEN